MLDHAKQQKLAFNILFKKEAQISFYYIALNRLHGGIQRWLSNTGLRSLMMDVQHKHEACTV
jgi:hypothetical protein